MRSVKNFLFLVLLVQVSFAQNTPFNQQKDYVAEGYDLVSYFGQKAEKGSSKYMTEYQGNKFKFSSQQHLEQFLSDPERYLPQYGGWCAYAMATEGEKVKIDPKTFEIRNGKLFLFYNAFFNNTLESWLEEGPEELIPRADKNWEGF